MKKGGERERRKYNREQTKVKIAHKTKGRNVKVRYKQTFTQKRVVPPSRPIHNARGQRTTQLAKAEYQVSPVTTQSAGLTAHLLVFVFLVKRLKKNENEERSPKTQKKDCARKEKADKRQGNGVAGNQPSGSHQHATTQTDVRRTSSTSPIPGKINTQVR